MRVQPREAVDVIKITDRYNISDEAYFGFRKDLGLDFLPSKTNVATVRACINTKLEQDFNMTVEDEDFVFIKAPELILQKIWKESPKPDSNQITVKLGIDGRKISYYVNEMVLLCSSMHAEHVNLILIY